MDLDGLKYQQGCRLLVLGLQRHDQAFHLLGWQRRPIAITQVPQPHQICQFDVHPSNTPSNLSFPPTIGCNLIRVHLRFSISGISGFASQVSHLRFPISGFPSQVSHLRFPILRFPISGLPSQVSHLPSLPPQVSHLQVSHLRFAIS